MSLNSLFFKYCVYYPATLVRGEFFASTLKQLLKSQWQTPEQLAALQLKKINNLIAHAKQYTDYYSDKLPDRLNHLSELSTLPLLEKDAIRQAAGAFESKKTLGTLRKKTTGGSTGAPVTILKNNVGMAEELAATWRGYDWAKIGIGDKQARFWGVPMQSNDKRRAALIDFVANRLRLSAFSFSQEDMHHYTQQLESFKPVYFYGYVSMIKQYAQFVDENKFSHKFNLTCIITTSEVLSDIDKQYISRVFNCPVFNEYGCGEIGTIAHECEQGHLHITAENMIVEVVDAQGSPLPNNQVGEIVVTDLTNFMMPLIRYKMKDYGVISDEQCPCGRGLPLLKGIQGRAYDMLKNHKGDQFHGEFFLYMIEDIKKAGLSVNGYQVEQVAINSLIIRLVCREQDYRPICAQLTQKIIAGFDENVILRFEKVHAIEREASGKLRVVKRSIDI